MASEPLNSMPSPANAEKIREQLAREPQLAGLPWPPPRGWKWHETGVQIRQELAELDRALAAFSGSQTERLSLESHQRRVKARFDRWRKIVFFSGWRPWRNREEGAGT